jgi:hypothetical protein
MGRMKLMFSSGLTEAAGGMSATCSLGSFLLVGGLGHANKLWIIPERLDDSVGGILGIEVGVTRHSFSKYDQHAYKQACLQHYLAHDINRQSGRVLFHLDDLSLFGRFPQLLAEDDRHIDHVRQECHQVPICEARIEHRPEPFPCGPVQPHHVVVAEQFAQIEHNLWALVEGLAGSHPLGRDIRIRDEEPSRAKRPQVKIKNVAKLVLLLDVSAPSMRVSLWRKVLLTVGCDWKIPKQERRPRWGWLELDFRTGLDGAPWMWSRTSFSISFRTL